METSTPEQDLFYVTVGRAVGSGCSCFVQEIPSGPDLLGHLLQQSAVALLRAPSPPCGIFAVRSPQNTAHSCFVSPKLWIPLYLSAVFVQRQGGN